MNNDGYLSNGDLFNCLKMLVGDNLTDIQIQQLSDRTLIAADKDHVQIQDLSSMDMFGTNPNPQTTSVNWNKDNS